MNSRTIAAGAIVLLAIGGLLYWGRANQSVSADEPIRESGLAAAETFYDFGEISMARGNVSKIFELENPTGKDITLERLTTSCMCTTAFIVKDGKRRGPFGMPGHGGPVPRANEVIRAGGKLAIDVVYDPNAHGPAGVGPIDRFVYLVDETGGQLSFEIKANVTP